MTDPENTTQPGRPSPRRPTSTPPPGAGWLLPREHGAYAELAFPLITGLALVRPSWPAWALGLAAVAFFLAHEPLGVAMGIRGKRLQEKAGGRAWTQGGSLLGVGGALGVAGVLGSGGAVWPAILLPGAAVAALIPLVQSGRQKTIPGEILVLTAFSTLLLPLAAASGAEPVRAGASAMVWWVSFFLGTLEVHAIKARHKKDGKARRISKVSPVASGVVVLLALVGLVAGEGLQWISALALLPPATGILALALVGIHPRHLKRVGWTLVGANTLTLLILLLA